MIHFFYGNSSYLLTKTIRNWKEQFIKKHGDIQLTHIKDYSSIGSQNIEQTLTSGGLFAEKKLIIFEGIPSSSQIKNKELIAFQENLSSLLVKKDESTLIMFSSLNPDKRGKFFKYLKKLVASSPEQIQMKELMVQDDNASLHVLQEKYKDIDRHTLEYLLKMKSGNIEKSISEIDKLLISYNIISIELISEIVMPELDQSIFIFIDNLLFGKKQEALRDMGIILSQGDIMSFYYGLISNLRLIVYIKTLKEIGCHNSEIVTKLKIPNRSFLIDKYKGIKGKDVNRLYMKLLDADKKMKKGDLSSFSQTPLKDEIECIILTTI